MPSAVTLKALGLNVSPNQLDLPEGSLAEASNVVIRRDGVIEPRRGFFLFDEGFGSASDRSKQLIVYKDRIINHYNNKLEFQTGKIDQNGRDIFNPFAGTYLETETGLRIKSIEANKNLYLTTSEGIKKISAKTAADFTTDAGFITQAGGIKALDLTSALDITLGNQSGFLPADSAVAYRVTWVTKDLNNNYIEGSPSQRSEIYNPLLNLLIQDFLRVLGALDDITDTSSTARIADGNYVDTLKLPITASASELRTNLISLASKLDNDILYANDSTAPLDLTGASGDYSVTSNVATINFQSGTVTDYISIGSQIYLEGWTAPGDVLNGAHTVTSVGASTLSFNITTPNIAVTANPATAVIKSNEYRSLTQPIPTTLPATNDVLVSQQTYLSSIITQLQSENANVISTPNITTYIDPLDVTTSANVILTITVPEAVNSNYFYRIYRSAIAQATGVQVLSDLTPNDEMQLVYEAYPTAAEITAHQIVVTDITPDAFRGTNLYSNEATGEGILQANDLPPYAKDINRFKNVVFYANTRTLQRQQLSILGVQNMITDFGLGTTPQLVITDGTTTNIYDFVTGQKEKTRLACVNGASLAAAGTASYFLLNSANDLREYYVWYKIGTATDPAISGKIGIQVNALAGDTSTQIADKTRDVLARYVNDFVVSSGSPSGNNVTIEATEFGSTTDATDGNIGGAFTITILTQGRGEKITQEISQITAVADVAGSLAGKYINLSTPFNFHKYYFWFKVSGVGVDPALAGQIGIEVDLVTNDSANTVATKLSNAVNTVTSYFTASALTNNVTVTNIGAGTTTDVSAGTSGFTVSVLQQGALEVLLSTNVSPAIAVDETARSLVRIINQNTSEIANAFYISSSTSVPGQFLIEGRTLSDNPIYFLTNNSNTGSSFNPDLGGDLTVTAISAANPTVLTFSTAHGLENTDSIVIASSNSFPSIDGVYPVTIINSTQVSIPVNVTSAGTYASVIKTSNAVFSQNETKPNRIYYSKYQQPEAVPIVNFLDVSAEDQAILRIFPLRDSLFVFKEDGLYRISGETAPFTVALFDSSCILIAPDSVSVSNNLIYCWTTQGIMTVSESGVNIISRPIDIDILKLGSANYPNFKTATWGVGYESDNSYNVFTIQETTDTDAQICYRYSNLTNTWTTLDKQNRCGIINPADDKMYLGAGDTNHLEEERKTFTRYDYADREITTSLADGKYFNTIIKFAQVSEFAEGDVLTQDQTVTVYGYNQLLAKLDIDTGVQDSNYESTLEAKGGDNMRTKLTDLATKLDSDLGVSDTDYFNTIDDKSGSITSITKASTTVITTSAPHGLFTDRIITIAGTNSTPTINGIYQVTVLSPTTFSINETVTTAGTTGSWSTVSGDFRDMKACYNKIINKLNNDIGVNFSNYVEIYANTLQEAVITKVNYVSKEITLNLNLDFIQGAMVVFKGITAFFTYSQITMNDPLSLKHFREATVMFESKAFTNAVLSFATDFLPQFIDSPLRGEGNGIFGHQIFGNGFFGGGSRPIPHRTYIPRPAQRCRYINVRFSHNVAREYCVVFGITVTGETGLSTRAYRS